MKAHHLVITCEHAGNSVPADYAHLFTQAKSDLESHLGYDPGALAIAIDLARQTGARLFENSVTRLLVECNRSTHHQDLFSKYTRNLSGAEKEQILKVYYRPYRDKVEKYIQRNIQKHPVIHLSIHTFTPVLNGVERAVEIGLLFDEDRHTEKLYCYHMQDFLTELLPQYCTLMNVPYKGADDGFTTHLRKLHGADRYLGIEIEVNQKFVDKTELNSISSALYMAVTGAMEQLGNDLIAL